MTHNFVSSDIVLGYGAYKRKRVLNKLIRFDTYIAIQYFSYALRSLTYMELEEI